MAEAEEKLKPIRAILETIRERADYALKQLQEAEEQRSMRDGLRARLVFFCCFVV
jgi:hypothetical protein